MASEVSRSEDAAHLYLDFQKFASKTLESLMTFDQERLIMLNYDVMKQKMSHKSENHERNVDSSGQTTQTMRSARLSVKLGRIPDKFLWYQLQ